MRTRFLTTDYFTTTNQTLPFLRFPLQSLPNSLSSSSSSTFDFDRELLRCIDSSTVIDISLQLDGFPVDNALSKFFSDVLPHDIDAGCEFSPIVQVPEKAGDLPYEESATENLETSNSQMENKSAQVRIKDNIGGQSKDRAVIIQFETPELSQHLENAWTSEKEKVQFLSEVQVCDDYMETFSMGLSDAYHGEVVDSVETVKTIYVEYDMEQESKIPEVLPLLNRILPCDSIYPVLEVDEIGIMEDSSWGCLEDGLHSFIRSLQMQHCTGSEDLELSYKNLLGSMEIDILEHIDGHHTSSMLLLDSHLESLNVALGTDTLQVVETSYQEKNTWMLATYLFEEFEMFDLEPLDIFQAHSTFQAIKETETCDQLFSRDMNFKGFDELVVSCELTVIDGSFTSLPIPVLMDDEKTLSLHVIIADKLSELEPVPVSTSDEIYLDWHLLEKDKCNILAAIEKVFNDIEDSPIHSNLEPNDGSMLVLDFILSDDPLDGLSMRENKLDMPSAGKTTVKLNTSGVTPRRLSDDDCQIIEDGGKLAKAEIENVESSRLSDDDDCRIIEHTGIIDGSEFRKAIPSLEPRSQFNDLDFFLNPTKATANMKIGCEVKVPESTSMFSGGLHKKEVASPNSIKRQKSDIRLHTVSLPANFTMLINNLSQTYTRVFRDDAQMTEIEFSIKNSSDINLLGLSEEKLIDRLSFSTKRKSCEGHWDETATNLVMLCAIKRMAWCLCFFGINTLHLFASKLFQFLDVRTARLCFLHSLIEDAYGVADKEILMSHPSLAIIKEILQQDTSQKSQVLILVQQFLWGPLKRVLTSINISFAELDVFMHKNQSDLCYDFLDAGARDHLQPACWLLPHEQISSSILMQKFDIILEYGGPSGSSKVLTLYPEYLGSRSFHFLKVELDGAAKALCEGGIASNDRGTIKLEDLLNFGSFTQNCTSPQAAGGTSPCSMQRPVCSMPQESMPVHSSDLSIPDMIIIINTQNFDKEMIISRRSTYQKILAMEKSGGQVVERDLLLPVDIVVDASTCIAWYDCKNIGKKASAQDEGSSSVPLCIENIAANILTSLSFTFSSCILIFEGESSFLGTVMESADELYAAAASLGISVQIFYSYSFELTDEIILNRIGHAMKFSKGLLPRLTESETLAESFLTKFPSINPLSAHAIINSGCTLLEFLQWPLEDRINALRKHHVPDESIDLLTLLCKYGEREESKSGVTDCSSSVSSPPDSAIVRKTSSDRKRKLISSDPLYDFRGFMPSNFESDGFHCQSKSRSDPKVSNSPRIHPKNKLPDLFGDELFDQDVTNEDPSKLWRKSNIPGAPSFPQTGEGRAQSNFLSNDNFYGQHDSSMAINGGEEYDRDMLQGLQEDVIGEVVDIFDKPLLGTGFQMAKKAVKSSPIVCEASNVHAPKISRAARRLSFGSSSYMNFPMADEMNTDCGFEADNRQFRADNNYYGGYNWTNSGFSHQKDPIGVGLMEKSKQNYSSPFLKEKEMSHYGETPLTKAIHSAQLQQGSPWTIEFLNRMKEKRMLRQQRQPRNASVLHSSSHGNINKVTKRRSPSILEYYKYQGGSIPRKVAEQKTHKQRAQLQNEEPSGIAPTWTPIDKRARRTLSFATVGTGSQTKLVWRDNISRSQDTRFSN